MNLNRQNPIIVISHSPPNILHTNLQLITKYHPQDLNLKLYMNMALDVNYIDKGGLMLRLS